MKKEVGKQSDEVDTQLYEMPDTQLYETPMETAITHHFIQKCNGTVSPSVLASL